VISGTRVERSTDHVVILVEGDLDLSTAPEVRSAFQRCLAEGSVRFVVDLTGCDLIDSAGLGVLLGLLRRSRAAGGDLQLVVPDHHVREVFESVDLDRVFVLHQTSDSAAHALHKPAERTG
jgi:anti-sigma B factor antagonist